MIVAFVASVAVAPVALVYCLRQAFGLESTVTRPCIQTTSVRQRANLSWALAGLLTFLVLLTLTRWPAAAVAAGVLVVMAPRVANGGSSERARVEKVEALALWTESLRDAAQAASGLESAIAATVESAPRLLTRPLRGLRDRLASRVPLPEALAWFADEIADAGADMVVAALTLNARQRGGSLTRVLTTLAQSTREELELRRRVLHERNAVRRQSRQIAALALGLAVSQAAFTRDWMAPYRTALGQLVLVGLTILYTALLMRLRGLSDHGPEPRFLSTAEASMLPAQRGTIP